jgi:hypothetical protein
MRSRTGATAADYIVDRKQILETDPFRMTSERKARLIDDLTKASELTREEITAFVEGKKYRPKAVFDPMKQRAGAEGYSTDLPFVLEMYNSWMARRRMASKMRTRVRPLIDRLQRTGREDLANWIHETGSYVMGRQHPWSRAVDNTLAQIPFVRDRVRSHLLDRWSSKVKWSQRFLLLTASPKFHALNRMQTFQLLWPIVGRKTGGRFWGRQKGFSAADQQLLDRHNVRFITGGKLEEAGKPLVAAKTRQGVAKYTAGLGSAETFNQQMAWLELYDHGRRLGLPDQQAANYAFLRGNIYSQFAHFRADVPGWFRNPITTTLMQFRRFPIKTYEFLWDRLRSGETTGLTKFIIMHLAVGGLRATTGLTAKVGTLAYLLSETLGADISEEYKPAVVEQKMYKELKEAIGETAANGVFWGLPGLVDLDLSYSVQLVDRDYGASAAEEVVNELAGPVVSTGMSAAKAIADTKGPVQSPLERAGRSTAHRVSGLRWILALEKILSQDYNFKTPSGKKRFEGDLQDVIIEGLGGRPTQAGQLDLLIAAYSSLKESYDSYADEATGHLLAGRTDEAHATLDTWNQLHPEIPLTFPMLKDRIKRRAKDQAIYLDERFYKRLPKSLKIHFLLEESEEGS